MTDQTDVSLESLPLACDLFTADQRTRYDAGLLAALCSLEAREKRVKQWMPDEGDTLP